MRQKVHDYLVKPSKKARAELTSEEQRWVDKQLGDKKAASSEQPKKK